MHAHMHAHAHAHTHARTHKGFVQESVVFNKATIGTLI